MLYISETVRPIILVNPKDHYRNDIWGIKWSRDRRRHVTPKSAVRIEVRSAIIATAWLLVMFTDAGAYFMQYTQQAI